LTEDRAFARDGVVHLRGVLSAQWVRRMRDAVDRELGAPTMTNLTAMGDALHAAGTPLTREDRGGSRPRGQFRAGTDHGVATPEFLAFARDTPVPSIVAELLVTERLWLYEDSVLVKEPGAADRTAFHQDLAYFHLDGDQVCTVWIPLDPVDAANGAVRYVRGSHRDRTVFRPNLFVTTQSMPGTEGEEVTDRSDDPALVHFSTQPGDVVIHHARTVHGAFANRTPDRPRRALSIRYAGDDARFRVKPGAPQKRHNASLVEGEPLSEPACPLVWPGARAVNRAGAAAPR
jgi:ectoine hydroxylase-related dioxygenase (phytanoyl-CoA dioxygenase family)